MVTIEELITKGAELGASDVHLAKGVPPKFRIDGQLQDAKDISPLTEEECLNYAKRLAGDKLEAIKEIGQLDLSETIADHRIRINLFRQQGAISASMRILADEIPVLSTLGLPPVVSEFAKWQKGIILVTGETGSGKSTTLAAILDQINHTRREHIITLEDPIEYIYKPDLCLVNQREIGTDTQSYADGLRAILREDPDIILIGEMRDPETIETAMTAAETGHLVFATLHTNSAVESIDRIVGVFPAERQQQIRLQLSTTIQAVLSQQLLLKKSGHGRVVACEAMIMTAAIRNMIREGKTPQMQSALVSSSALGSISMDNSLVQMVKDGSISIDQAIEASANPDHIKKNVGGQSFNITKNY